MTFRKQRRPTPGFGVPPPFKPVTGTHSTLREDGTFPYCAMMQVAAADIYEDYVVCRGFDPRIRKFIDYDAADANKPGISVAKPYGNRKTGVYQVAEMYPAFLPTQGVMGEGKREDYTPPSPTGVDMRLGTGSGTAPAAGTGGQPTDLGDTVEALTDHNGVLVQWLLVDRGTGIDILWGKCTANWTDNGALTDHVTVNPCDDAEGANPTVVVHTVLLPKVNMQDPDLVSGDVIAYVETIDGTYVCVSDYLGGGTSSPVLARVTDGSGVKCTDTVDDNAVCLFPGETVTLGATATMCLGDPWVVSTANVWIVNLDQCGPGDVVWPGDRLGEDEVFLTDLIGTFAYDGGEELPLYAIREQILRDHVYWGVAQEQWTNVGSGSCSYVNVKLATSCAGAGVTGSNIQVYLPRNADRDPNVCTNDVIAFHKIKDAADDTDTFVCVSDYLDDKIGTVKMWALSAGDIPCGWAIMNGSDNATPDGSGIDMTDRFVKAKSVAGQAAGKEKHTHEIDLQIEEHTVTQILAAFPHNHTIEVQIEEHTETELKHVHPVFEDTPSNGWEVAAVPNSPDPILPCTDEPIEVIGGGLTEDCASGEDWGPLTHEPYIGYSGPAVGVSGAGASLSHVVASSTIDETSHEYLNMSLIFIERIDNSL